MKFSRSLKKLDVVFWQAARVSSRSEFASIESEFQSFVFPNFRLKREKKIEVKFQAGYREGNKLISGYQKIEIADQILFRSLKVE